MTVALYLDHIVNPAVAGALRRRGIDCITAREDDAPRLSDTRVPARTTELGRVLYTEDQDFLHIVQEWARSGRSHAGVVCSRQRRLSVGELIEQLTSIALASDPIDWRAQLRFLPL